MENNRIHLSTTGQQQIMTHQLLKGASTTSYFDPSKEAACRGRKGEEPKAFNNIVTF